MGSLFELAALSPDGGLAPEEALGPGEEPLSGFVVLSVLGHVVGLTGYFVFPPVCLRLIRECMTQRPGWKKAAASVAVGLALAVACQAVAALPLYFRSVLGQPLKLDDNALMIFLAGQMAVSRLGPLLLAAPVFMGLRKLLGGPINTGMAAIASRFGLTYLLLFCLPLTGFVLFKDYAGLMVEPEFLLRPAKVHLAFGVAAVPVLLLLLRSLIRQARTAPKPLPAVVTAAYIAIPLLPLPAWIFNHLCYAAQAMAARWPNTAVQTLADYSLAFVDPLWKPLLTALAAAAVLKLCAGRVISGTQGRLAKTMVLLGAASLYIITACLLFLGGYGAAPL